jgi:hypothetical protein
MRHVSLDALGVEALGMAQLVIDVDDEGTSIWSMLRHEIECKLAGELNEPIIAGLGYDEDGLYARVNSCTRQLPGHFSNADRGLGELAGE